MPLPLPFSPVHFCNHLTRFLAITQLSLLSVVFPNSRLMQILIFSDLGWRSSLDKTSHKEFMLPYWVFNITWANSVSQQYCWVPGHAYSPPSSRFTSLPFLTILSPLYALAKNDLLPQLPTSQEKRVAIGCELPSAPDASYPKINVPVSTLSSLPLPSSDLLWERFLLLSEIHYSAFRCSVHSHSPRILLHHLFSPPYILKPLPPSGS